MQSFPRIRYLIALENIWTSFQASWPKYRFRSCKEVTLNILFCLFIWTSHLDSVSIAPHAVSHLFPLSQCRIFLPLCPVWPTGSLSWNWSVVGTKCSRRPQKINLSKDASPPAGIVLSAVDGITQGRRAILDNVTFVNLGKLLSDYWSLQKGSQIKQKSS